HPFCFCEHYRIATALVLERDLIGSSLLAERMLEGLGLRLRKQIHLSGIATNQDLGDLGKPCSCFGGVILKRGSSSRTALTAENMPEDLGAAIWAYNLLTSRHTYIITLGR